MQFHVHWHMPEIIRNLLLEALHLSSNLPRLSATTVPLSRASTVTAYVPAHNQSDFTKIAALPLICQHSSPPACSSTILQRSELTR